MTYYSHLLIIKLLFKLETLRLETVNELLAEARGCIDAAR
jgi:hypothetical protein